MNIVLIGYRCCGKTSAGRLIAGKLGRRFIDTDEMITEIAGCSIDEIVSSKGWQHFRDIERDVIKDVSSMNNMVISAGGGVIIDEVNVKNLKANGFLVWLYADVETIKKRLNADKGSAANRPSLTGDDPSDEIVKVLEYRNPLYKNACDMAVDTSHLDMNEVVEIIIEEIEKRN